MVLATARGLALLLLLGHPEPVVRRQWSYALDQQLGMIDPVA